jgi:4-hydroxybenzoyl-CoA thioesterase
VSERLQVRVYLEDTDAGGIVYHTAYLRFMERARTDTLRLAGVQQSDTFKLDVSFVLHSMSLRFHQPAQLDDELSITCAMAEQRGASMTFRQEVRNVANGVLHCSADVVVACISLSSKKPRRVPSEVLEKLAALQAPQNIELSPPPR